MKADTAQRAMRAFDLMGRTGLGARNACSLSGTTPRSLIKWMDLNGIQWSYKRRGRGRPLQIVPARSPEQKVPDFLEALNAGRSATAAAKDLDTTVKTMSKQVLEDSSGKLVAIVDKDGGRWVPNFVPIHKYSTVVYGKLESMDGSTLGRGGQAGPNSKTTRGEDYTDIWWQFDLDPLTSTLDPVDAVRYHRPKIVQRLVSTLLKPNINNNTLSSQFLSSNKVRGAAVAAGRWPGSGPMKVSRLEELLQRFNLRFQEIRMGVDDNVDPAGIQFMSKSDLTPPGSGPIKMPTGRFQVFFLDKDQVTAYPPTGIKIRYRYDLSDELA